MMIQRISLNVSFSLLIGIFTLYFLTSLGFALGLGINIGYILAAVLAMIYVPIKCYDFSIKETLISIVFIVFLICFGTYYMGNIADMSTDGQWYHQTGIIFLKKGWNPVYVTAADFLNQNWKVEINGMMYVNSYPKFCEIIAANIFYLTENIETGKILNVLSLVMLPAYAFYVLNSHFLKSKKWLSALFSLLLILNPVSLAQAYTFYTDGEVYAYFMLMLLAIADIEKSNKKNKTAITVLIISAVILSGIKLGGLCYAVEILAIYGLYLFYTKSKLRPYGKWCGIILLLFLLMNINPYSTNLKQGKHLLYPLAGSQKVDVLSHNMPSQFYGKIMPYKLFMSTFSRVDNSFAEYQLSDTKIKLKIPFSVDKEEIEKLKIYDIRQCGFGIFWSGILLFSIILAFFIRKLPAKNKQIYRLTMAILALSVLLNPENWWARYVPQFYATPVWISLFYMMAKKSSKRVFFSGLLSLIIFVNSALLYVETKKQADNYTLIKTAQINNMEEMKRQPEVIKNLEQSKIRDDFSSTVLLFLDKYGRK